MGPGPGPWAQELQIFIVGEVCEQLFGNCSHDYGDFIAKFVTIGEIAKVEKSPDAFGLAITLYVPRLDNGPTARVSRNYWSDNALTRLR